MAQPIPSFSQSFSNMFSYDFPWLSATDYRKRRRRVMATPPNITIPPPSIGTVWASSPSQGSACRGQGESNFTDFRNEFYLLDKTHAATNAEVHGKSNAEITFFCNLAVIWVVRGTPRGSFEDSAEQDPKTSAVAVHFGKLFWFILVPKSDFRAFCLWQLLCLFLASLLGSFR